MNWIRTAVEVSWLTFCLDCQKWVRHMENLWRHLLRIMVGILWHFIVSKSWYFRCLQIMIMMIITRIHWQLLWICHKYSTSNYHSDHIAALTLWLLLSGSRFKIHSYRKLGGQRVNRLQIGSKFYRCFAWPCGRHLF